MATRGITSEPGTDVQSERSLDGANNITIAGNFCVRQTDKALVMSTVDAIAAKGRCSGSA